MIYLDLLEEEKVTKINLKNDNEEAEEAEAEAEEAEAEEVEEVVKVKKYEKNSIKCNKIKNISRSSYEYNFNFIFSNNYKL